VLRTAVAGSTLDIAGVYGLQLAMMFLLSSNVEAVVTLASTIINTITHSFLQISKA
jgi:hypothetical protein